MSTSVWSNPDPYGVNFAIDETSTQPKNQSISETDPNGPIDFATVQKGFLEIKEFFESSMKDQISTLANSFNEQITGLRDPQFNTISIPNPPPPPSQPTSSSVSSPPSCGTPKFKEPTVFTGKATQVVGFLQEIRDTLYLLRNTYTTDKNKCIYLATYLGNGTPKEWYKSVLIADEEHIYNELKLINNFTQFTAAFKKHFGDSDLVATAHNKIVSATRVAVHDTIELSEVTSLK